MEREIKENAICLKVSDSGEYDKILTLIGVDHGLIRAKIKGVKKPKAKLAFCSFPFAFGEYVFVRTGSSNTVINCSHVDSFFDLSTDLNKFYAGFAVLELTRLIIKENQPCTGLFVSLLKTLQTLCYKDFSIISVLTKYVLDCLEFCGFSVTIDVDLDLQNKCYFSFENGRVTNKDEGNDCELSQRDAESLAMLLSGDISIIEQETNTSKNLLKLLKTFFEIKIDERLEILQKFC